MKNPVYLDGFATMPLAPEAQNTMLEVWREPSNAGSPHLLGERAAMYVADARQLVADLIGASAPEICFTSGATEANNMVILGVARWALKGGSRRRKIIVSSIEHKAVLAPAESLRSHGFEIIYAPVDGNGIVDCTLLAGLATDDVLIMSVMLANNETGALQPINEVTAIARTVGALVHCDGAQAAGKIAIDVLDIDVDYLSLSAHKLYGPGGVGALYIAANAPRPQPLIFGGGQQTSLRPGTEPVALIAGFGAAVRIASSSIAADAKAAVELSQHFRSRLWAAGLGAELTIGNRQTLPGAMSIYLPNIDAEELVTAISADVAISTGSACTSGQLMPSHVLSAMGLSEVKARSIFRVMLNRYNSLEDVTFAADKIVSIARRLQDRTGRAHQ
ncbi:cysteine desulfurase family protein [Brucella pseudogrignonensis]|uniref:cysteine desulfurase family protein n=1 Tax=Brucella pseudogrignonensis TaxID=419475 RepID=UPI003D969718